MNKYGEFGSFDCYKKTRSKKMKIKKHGSFTLSYDEHLNSIAFVVQGGKNMIINSARWDTGSEYTYISQKTASGLVPDPLSSSTTYGIGRSQDGHVYYVDLVLPGGILISNIDVADLDLSSLKNADAIIGMDVIRQGKLTVNGQKGTFSFEI